MADRNNRRPTTRRGAITAAVGAAFLPSAAAQGQGGAWPNRPVRIVVAWPPGGGADIPARLAAGPMQQILGQTMVIENRAGASGSVATGMDAQSPPDGYPALAGTAAISVNHLLLPGWPYDAATALVPVSLVALSPLMLVVRADHPARSLQDLIARMRAAPGRVAYGHSGTGTVTQLAPVRMLASARVEGNGAAYRGGGPSGAGLMAGDVEFVLYRTRFSGQ